MELPIKDTIYSNHQEGSEAQPYSVDYEYLFNYLDNHLGLQNNQELQYAVQLMLDDLGINSQGGVNEWKDVYIENRTKDIRKTVSAFEALGYSMESVGFSFLPTETGHQVDILQDGRDASPVTYLINERTAQFKASQPEKTLPKEIFVINQYVRDRIANNGFIINDLIRTNGTIISVARINELLLQETQELSIYKGEEPSIDLFSERVLQYVCAEFAKVNHIEELPLIKVVLKSPAVSSQIEQLLIEMDHSLGKTRESAHSSVSGDIAKETVEKCLSGDYKFDQISRTSSIVEAARVLGRAELLTPISIDKVPDLKKVLNYLPINLRETVSRLGDSKDEKVRTSARFFATSLSNILDRSKDSLHDSEEIEEIIHHLANHAFDTSPMPLAFYYAFSKLKSPLRTGSDDGQIDLAEIEMLHKLAKVQKEAQFLGMNIKFVLVNEATESVGSLLKMDQMSIEKNVEIAKDYLSQINAGDAIEIRSLKDDMREIFGDDFSDLHQQAKKKITETNFTGLDHRIAVLMACIPVEGLQELGISNEEIQRIQMLFIQGNYDNSEYPRGLVNYAKEFTAHFNGIMEMRSDAKSRSGGMLNPPPQYLSTALHIGVTRSASRLSFSPSKRFRGEMTFPNHGIPVYHGGQYEGNIPLWHLIINKNSFKIVTVNEKIVGAELLPLSVKLNFLSQENEG